LARSRSAQRDFERRVNERVLEAFVSRFHLKYRPFDVELGSSALLWSINTPDGRLALMQARRAEEYADAKDTDHPFGL
jgi:hypothetical protein